MKGSLFKFEVERVTKKNEKLKAPGTAHKMNKIRKTNKHGHKHEGKHKKTKGKGQRVVSKTNHLKISGDRELLRVIEALLGRGKHSRRLKHKGIMKMKINIKIKVMKTKHKRKKSGKSSS